MRVLITGIAGFYGRHLADYLRKNTDWEIVGLDKQSRPTWRGVMCEPFRHDLRKSMEELQIFGKIDIVIHLAAQSHVDNSISDPLGAVQDNVVGTANLLEAVRILQPSLFIYFSTDEVYGPNEGNTKFKEWDRFKPGNPYSATKAAAEDLCLAYHNTYGVPVIITHSMNIFGECQHPEKFIPKATKLVLQGEEVDINADKTATISGSRSYIHADDVSRALMLVIEKGKIGEKYNIAGGTEVSNLDMGKMIAQQADRPLKWHYVAANEVRPGNDFSYGIDGSRLHRMGFKPVKSRKQDIKKVIQWYIDNPTHLGI